MKIANIIYEEELVNHTKSDYINYINAKTEYSKLQELWEAENIHEAAPPYRIMPTLYVGWSFMKDCNPDNPIIQNADILRKKIIANELYWECSFAESKSSHVKGVDNFVKLAPQFYFQPKFTYINLDPVFFQIVDVQGLMDVLPKEINMMYNFKNEMLYILHEDKITGINLKMYEYFKFDTKEIIERIIERSETSYEDPQGIFYQDQYKIFPNYPYLKRYLIVILSN
jgi:hypothetical protein